MSDEPCAHETVSFGSGGHYIFCVNCRAIWCSRPEGDGAMTPESYKAAMTPLCQNGPKGGQRKAP